MSEEKLTPTTRAEHVMAWYEGHGTESPALRDEVAAQIRAAVEAEREEIISAGKGILLELNAEFGHAATDAELMRRLESAILDRG